MTRKKPLAEYQEKRDFRRTAEPAGGRKRPDGKPIFVIQKHDASHLHYDLRLEVAGVLKSWAVPKGPSVDPADKRLAVETEDHPLEYAGFEGTIPEGEYGAGTVMVWDTGTYRNLKKKGDFEVPMGECFSKGHITVWLDGSKLKGGYSLTRFRKENSRQWLLVKMKDEEAAPGLDIISSESRSALTGRTLQDIAREGK
ncbi:MAG: DNA polymerase ligase N-terminal domain-containing protein [Candidatus Sulfobium sp.]|jgi:DNA ligase D-like protein (predicted 3'-phosphoesterase)